MPVMLAGFGGLFCGVLAAFVVSLIAAIPTLQWLDHLIIPTIYVVAPLSAIYIALKTLGAVKWPR